jgi:hypothetical protein
MDAVMRVRLSTSYDLRTLTVELALAAADVIHAVDTSEVIKLRKNLEDV